MKILIDTHCWLWWFLDPERLNSESRKLIASRHNEIFLSAVSSWEIVIKVGLGKLTLPLPPKEYIPSRLAKQGMSSLPVKQAHALQVGELPDHHRDPFDRLLIAQAQVEALSLLTADPQIKNYDVQILWAGEV